MAEPSKTASQEKLWCAVVRMGAKRKYRSTSAGDSVLRMNTHSAIRIKRGIQRNACVVRTGKDNLLARPILGYCKTAMGNLANTSAVLCPLTGQREFANEGGSGDCAGRSGEQQLTRAWCVEKVCIQRNDHSNGRNN